MDWYELHWFGSPTATCTSACVILYHVTGSCKRPFIQESKGNPLEFLNVIVASGIGRGRVRTTMNDDGCGVAQDGGHTPANRLTATCSLDL